GAGDTELGEPSDVLRGEALSMLDALAEAPRRPNVAGCRERVECLPVRTVADRVHPHRPAAPRSLADHMRELVAARDRHTGAAEQPGRLRAERPVHERLQVADPQVVVADARVEAERLELV